MFFGMIKLKLRIKGLRINNYTTIVNLLVRSYIVGAFNFLTLPQFYIRLVIY